MRENTYHNDKWKDHISKRVTRLETTIFLMIILCAAFLSIFAYSYLFLLSPTFTPSKSESKEILHMTQDYQHTTLSNVHKAMKLEEQKIEEMQLTIHQLEEKWHSENRLLHESNENKVKKRKNIIVHEHPSYTRFSKVLYNDETIKTKHISNLPSRNLQDQISLPCNGTSFHLELRLDGQAEQISWELTEKHTGLTLLNRNYKVEDSHLNDDYLHCLEPGQYVFSLKDSRGDGLDCEHGSVCFNIYSDNKLTSPQGPSFKRSLDYLIDTNSSYCAVGSSFLLTVFFDVDSGITWVLQDSLSNNVINLEPLVTDSNDGSRSYISCLASGIYTLNVYDKNGNIHCSHGEDCYRILINDRLIFEADEFRKDSILSFRISRNGSVMRRWCHEQFILSSTNEVNNFGFDLRSAQIMNIISAISSVDLVHHQGSYLQKAACWIIHDDELQISPSTEFMFQRYILAAFLYAIGENAEMILPMNECDFDKFICDRAGSITEINLFEYGIHGVIPSELSFLRDLEILNLSENNLIGSFPSELGSLIRIREIDLSTNKLTGSIPSEIGKLPLLTKLQLNFNDLEGSIPSDIGNCQILELLDLEGCNLERTMPTEIYNLTSLKTLNLKGNKLSGSISSHIHQLASIEKLWLGNNQFRGTIPSQVGNLTSLEWIFFGFNHLTGPLPSEIGNLRMLREFAIMDNKMNSTLTDIFGNMNSMRRFDVSDNSFFGSIPESLWHMESIEEIILTGNDLTGKVPDSLCESNITIEVDDSHWFGHKPKVIYPCYNFSVSCHLWDPRNKINAGQGSPICPQSNVHGKAFFSKYWFQDNIALAEKIFWGPSGNFEFCVSPTGCYTSNYNKLVESNLITYNLAYSNISKSLVEEDKCDAIEVCGMFLYPEDPKRAILNHLTQIVVPDLNVLYDFSSPEHEAICWMLTEDVFLDEIEICDGTILQRYILVFIFFSQKEPVFDHTKRTCEWDKVTCDETEGIYVEHLDFSRSKLTGTLFTELGLLTRLKTIKLTNNTLTGTIDPIIFSNMPNLMEFSIGTNQIEGHIPKELFGLPTIRTIDVSNNKLVGTLPHDIHYSESIVTLNVRNNLLHGKIADALFSCHKLEKIDLSRNNFDGRIPVAIGNLRNLREIQFQENSLSGSIPILMFNSLRLEKLMLQSNMFTGSIPTQIGTLTNITQITMSHNSLKGTIPTEFKVLKKMKLLHLHNNKLTGTAPILGFVDDNSERYITDCGEPFFSLPSLLECETCSICCNSLQYCQYKYRWEIPIEVAGFITAILTPIGMIVLLYSIWKINKNGLITFTNNRKHAIPIHNENSVFCFIFSKNRKACLFYAGTVVFQTVTYTMFLRRADFDKEGTDWAYTMRCPESDIECTDDKETTIFGWACFGMITLFYLGTDLIEGLLQFCDALTSSSALSLTSGFIQLFLTVLAVFTSILYNFALAQSDTDLIMNAVILLFISDLDEQCFNVLRTLVPQWTYDVVSQIEIQ